MPVTLVNSYVHTRDLVGASVVTDTFTGSNGASWNGTNWQQPAVSGTTTIQGNKGRFATASGEWGGGEVRAQNSLWPGQFDVLLDVTPVVRSGAERWESSFLVNLVRRPYGGDTVQFRLNGASEVVMKYAPVDFAADEDTTFADFGTLGIGDTMHVRVRWSGTTAKAKWWKNAAAEPASWQWTRAATGTATLGYAGCTLYNSDSGGIGEFDVDNLDVREAL